MAEGNWSVVRVEKISAEGAQKTERHNERKNESYANLNVDTEQIARNVHFKDTGGLTYNEYFQRLIDEGKISTRGQKAGATIFNELVIDVNTRYFEEHGGYEYARQFYEEAYRFGCEIYGEDNIVSAVMHADEINKAVSEELGKPVYHYHLHIVAIPTVRKEILWSKRCKDEALRGTVKEVINQVSHSKKWKNTVPLLDENGQQVISKYGKPTLTMSMGVTAFAAGDPITVVNNLSDFIFGLIRAVGLILLGWGIVQVGLSFQSHDPSQRSNGFLTLAGGVIITFAKEILNLIVG